MSRIDHAEASSKFIEAKDHLEFHDRRLWDLRKKRDRESEICPNGRSSGRSLRRSRNTRCHTWPTIWRSSSATRSATGASALGQGRRRAQPDRVRHHEFATARKVLVKAKSMLTDECDMRPFLENRGIEVMETDLGERIQQLDDEPPSHIVVPAVHKLRGDVARVFSQTIGTDPDNSDVHYLAESQRQHTRPIFSGPTRA